jgi:hypothetical protein
LARAALPLRWRSGSTFAKHGGDKVTKNIPALLLAIGLLFAAVVGMTAYGEARFSPVAGIDPATATASSSSSAVGLLPCICNCGYECDGITCDVDAPDDCSDDALITRGLSCCSGAPNPDPACKADPIFADGGHTSGVCQVGG